jgi:hypothetical protein
MLRLRVAIIFIDCSASTRSSAVMRFLARNLLLRVTVADNSWYRRHRSHDTCGRLFEQAAARMTSSIHYRLWTRASLFGTDEASFIKPKFCLKQRYI